MATPVICPIGGSSRDVSRPTFTVPPGGTSNFRSDFSLYFAGTNSFGPALAFSSRFLSSIS